MSVVPAITDQDFIRLSFSHFEECCRMGDLFFRALRCSEQMGVEVL